MTFSQVIELFAVIFIHHTCRDFYTLIARLLNIVLTFLSSMD